MDEELGLQPNTPIRNNSFQTPIKYRWWKICVPQTKLVAGAQYHYGNLTQINNTPASCCAVPVKTRALPVSPSALYEYICNLRIPRKKPPEKD